MDVHVLVRFLNDAEVISVSSSCSSGFAVLSLHRDHVLARGLLRLLDLLADHTGAATTAEWQAEDRYQDDLYFRRHIVDDWDLSD